VRIYKEGKTYLKRKSEEITLRIPPFRQDLLYTMKEAWDVYKGYTTSAQTMSRKRDREKERDPDGIYLTDR
jgi:hypothetical protein